MQSRQNGVNRCINIKSKCSSSGQRLKAQTSLTQSPGQLVIEWHGLRLIDGGGGPEADNIGGKDAIGGNHPAAVSFTIVSATVAAVATAAIKDILKY